MDRLVVVAFAMLSGIWCNVVAQAHPCVGREVREPLGSPIYSFDEKTVFLEIIVDERTWCEMTSDFIYFGSEEARDYTNGRPYPLTSNILKLEKIVMEQGKIYFYGPFEYDFQGCAPIYISPTAFNCRVYGE